jgi:hypothetical protein
LLVQVTVVPTATVRAAGWKLKLAIETAVPATSGGAAEGAADAAGGGALDAGAVGAGEELPEQAASANRAGRIRVASRA